MVEHQLNEAFAAGGDRLFREKHDPRPHLGGGVVQSNRHPLADGFRLAREHLQPGIDPVGRRVQFGIEHDVAARDRILGDFIARQIERAALARHAPFRGPVLRMDRAYARVEAGRADNNPIAARHGPRQNRAGYDGARAGKGEGAVDREPKAALGRARRACARGFHQIFAQRIDAFAGEGRDRNDVGVGESGGGKQLPDIVRDFLAPGRLGEIRLGQGDGAARNAEQIDDREVLDRLRHHAVVGGDGEQDEIDAGRAGEHVMNEALVPRHVDEADDRAICRRQIGKAEIDRDAARFFFLQAVGVDPGQRAHERGLAVVDMAGGADDHDAASGRDAAARRSASATSAGERSARAG